MRKNRFLAAVAAVIAGISLVSCQKIQDTIDSLIEVSVTAQSDVFDANGEAAVKFSLNSLSNKDVTVIIGISNEAQTGHTAVSAEALDFEGTVTIPASEKFKTVTIKINDKAQAGQQAVITIASASGATVGANSTVYISVPSDYGNGPDTPPVQEDGLTFRSDWTATILGEPYWYSGYAYFDVQPTFPGIKYFWMDTFTKEELDQYYEGSVKALLEDYSESIKENLSKGYDITEILFSDADSDFYVSYYGAGATTLYILEFDGNGDPTYNYGAVDVDLPEIEDDEEEDYEPLEVNFRADWTGTYEGRTGDDPEYPDVMTVTACDAAYFTVCSYPAGTLAEASEEEDGLSNLVESAALAPWVYMAFYGYTIEDLCEYGIVANSVPASFTDDLMKGEYECIIAAVDEEGNATGDYGYFTFEAPGPDLPDLKYNSNWGAVFSGNYYSDYYEADLSVITITGIADGEFVAHGNIRTSGYYDDMTTEELQMEIYETVKDVISDYNYYYEEGETLADYVSTTAYSDILYYAFKEENYGEWDMLLTGMTADLGMTGDYAIVTVVVDGHEYGAEPATIKIKSVRKGNALGLDRKVAPAAGKLPKVDLQNVPAKKVAAAAKPARKSLSGKIAR